MRIDQSLSKSMTGNELKQMRTEELGLTQLQLAIELGVDPSTVAKWEQSKDQEISGSRMLALSLKGLCQELADRKEKGSKKK